MMKLSLSLPKYDSAMQPFFNDFYDELHMADDLMKNFPPEQVIHSGTIRFLSNPTILEESYKNHENINTGQTEIITQTNIPKFKDFLQDLFTPILNQAKQNTIEVINQICDTTGNNVEAKDRNVWDAYIEAIEQVEMIFDDFGNPSFIIYPLEIYDKLSEIAPTIQQAMKVEEIFRRKREEHLLKKQSRRLKLNLNKWIGSDEEFDTNLITVSLPLPRYNLAIMKLIRNVKEGFISLDPILGEIRSIPVAHGGITRQVSEPQILETPMRKYSVKVSLELEWFVYTDSEKFRDFLCKFSEEAIGQMKQHFFNIFPQICDATGNNINAQGKEFWDAYIEMMEITEMQFDENGNQDTVFIAHPNLIEKIQANPPTKEQLAKGNEIIERKKREYYAQKRTRRLS